MSHACPIPGCRATLHRTLLMCSEHWLMVPRAMRAQVSLTWHAVERTLGPSEERQRRIQAYRTARDAAIRVVAAAQAPVI